MSSSSRSNSTPNDLSPHNYPYFFGESTNALMNSSFNIEDDEMDEEIEEYVLSPPTEHLHYMQNFYSSVIDNPNVPHKPKQKRKHRNRDRDTGAAKLWKDYFDPEEPTFDADIFRTRFRMKRPLFLLIVEAITNHDPWFNQRPDAVDKLGFNALQKCSAAMHMLAYGSGYDQVDEYLRLAKTTAKSCLAHFVEAVINVFGPTYRRKPTPTDLNRLLQVGELRGFLGMLGSVDCMHWE